MVHTPTWSSRWRNPCAVTTVSAPCCADASVADTTRTTNATTVRMLQFSTRA